MRIVTRKRYTAEFKAQALALVLLVFAVGVVLAAFSGIFVRGWNGWVLLLIGGLLAPSVLRAHRRCLALGMV